MAKESPNSGCQVEWIELDGRLPSGTVFALSGIAGVLAGGDLIADADCGGGVGNDFGGMGELLANGPLASVAGENGGVWVSAVLSGLLIAGATRP